MNHKHDCRKLLGTLSDYVDGSLQDELCRELELHLSECQDCQVVVDTLKKTIDLYYSNVHEPSVPADVRRRLFKQLNLDGFIKAP